MESSHLKYLALYLPQFHAIPENDEWWGAGFTEWTNTKPMTPFFEGHYQPHEPSDEIGYYDLNDINVMIKQSEIAKRYGIWGFCYYYYWFNGKRLLEKPLENMLHEPQVDIPFCLCWANHNWTRKWDGMDQEILLAQTYDQTTYTRFIDDLSPYLKDPRYIKIDDRPMLLVYQADQISNPTDAVRTWRNHAKIKYNIDLYLVCVHQSSQVIPQQLGYDAAVDFTPKWRSDDILPNNEHPRYFNDNISTTLVDYRKNTLKSILQDKTDFKLFRCVYPMWDNSARRKHKGAIIIVNSSLNLFKRFLIEMSKITVASFRPEERFLFINAWNEWAEGTHLEPCKKYGDKLLGICREVLSYPKNTLMSIGFVEGDLDWIKSLLNDFSPNPLQATKKSNLSRLNKQVKRSFRDLKNGLSRCHSIISTLIILPHSKKNDRSI